MHSAVWVAMVCGLSGIAFSVGVFILYHLPRHMPNEAARDSASYWVDSPPASSYWKSVEKNANSLSGDKYTPTLLALLVDLVRRRSSALDILSAGGTRAGQYIHTSSELHANIATAISNSGRDCRRPNTLLAACLLTSGESAFLQEWLVWHILQGWAHMFIMVDMQDEDLRWKETMQVCFAAKISPL